MASAAEQLAANMNVGAFAKATDLHKRLWFTLGALIVYRLGTYIPIPGIDPVAFAHAFQGQAKGILGMFNMFSGGAVQRMAIFSLNVMPYISASIIVQLMGTIYGPWEKLRKEGGEAGRKTLNQYTRYLTVVLALVQCFGIAMGLQTHAGAGHRPGLFFIALHGGDADRRHAVPDVAGRADHQPRRRQRHSLIIFAGIVAVCPRDIWQCCRQTRTGAMSPLRAAGHRRPGRRRGAGHRLLGARAAAAAGAVSQAPGGQPHVRRRQLLPAAEDQHRGRDPADLRLARCCCCRRR